jgi:hypothetical protein
MPGHDPALHPPAESGLAPDPRAHVPRSARNALLWYAVLGGPAAWTVDELASLIVHQSWCAAATSRQPIPFPAPVVWLALIGLVGAGATGVAGWVAWRAVRDLGPDTGRGETDLDRRRFMAHAGIIMSILFFFAIAMRWVAPLFVSASICNRGA